MKDLESGKVNSPEISIVMPVYNGEKFLRESIESVIGQTYQNWELIIVDDCSTDNSPVIMHEYEKKDPRINVVHNIKNKKIPKSLNIGFENASGTYFTWTSDDNRYKPEALEQMINFLEKEPMTGMVYADMDFIDETGKKTGEVSLEADNLYYEDCVGACFLYRSDVARKAGGYDPEWSLVQDYEYWLRLAEKSNICHLPVNLYEYRIHDESLTKTNTFKMDEQLNKMRMEKLDFILSGIQEEQKEQLFIDLYEWNRKLFPLLKQKFYGNASLPVNIYWLERERKINSDKQIIIFGAGNYGKQMLSYVGKDKVDYFADNNSNLVGKEIEGKEVISFERLQQIWKNYQTVIAVHSTKLLPIVDQLEKAGINEFITYGEMKDFIQEQ